MSTCCCLLYTSLNAIVWLYRGEVDKYKGLLAEYHAELADDRPFAEIQAALEQNVQAKREEAKAAVEAAPRKAVSYTHLISS